MPVTFIAPTRLSLTSPPTRRTTLTIPRINVRDRQDQTLTPLNQGNSKADVATTAQIRKEIIAAKNMSVNAQNVKIITIDGQVTLRGPVNTAEEKRLIGEIADRSAHSGNVDNQLEVQPTPAATSNSDNQANKNTKRK